MNATAVAFPLPSRQDIRAHWDGANAADLPTPLGTAWIAVFDGTARKIDSAVGGLAVYLTSSDGSVTAYYGHAQRDPDTRAHGAVKAGQTIGNVGMTGYTTGPHLHFALTTSGRVNAQGGGDIDPSVWLTGTTVMPGVAPDLGEDTAPTASSGLGLLQRPFDSFKSSLPSDLSKYAGVGAVAVAALVLFAVLED